AELTTDNKTSLTAAVNELKKEIDTKAAMDTYSTEPKRTGTWIDGTPIWRVAFERNFTEEEANENNVSLWNIIPAKDKNTPFVVNYCVNAFFTSPGLVDDIPGKIGSNVVSFDVAKNTFYTSDGLYGWIEFATPESNLKNPLTDPDTAVDPDPGEDEIDPPIGDEAGGGNSGGGNSGGGTDITFPDDDETDSGVV
ncbi:MAG: hypothetical protein Q4G33_13600, partial [bacterium]|nr:hypothetical protein [bacterium]